MANQVPCVEGELGNGRMFLARLGPEGLHLIESSSLFAKPLTRHAGTDGIPGLQCCKLAAKMQIRMSSGQPGSERYGSDLLYLLGCMHCMRYAGNCSLQQCCRLNII